MYTIPLWSGIIYGPIRSRRLGRSLGLNASPISYKLCSFNCVYCQFGWTAACTTDTAARLGDFPTPDDFERELERTLRRLKAVDNLTFSGNGEPTLHPQFEELVDIAIQLKDNYFPGARLGVLSNSSTVSIERVHKALAKLDFRIMKLDAGNLETFRKINRPCRGVDFGTILSDLKSLENVILQTMFVDGTTQNIGEREVRDWIEVVRELQPMKAQIYSLHRPPAEMSLREVPADRLREIAEQTMEATGVTVQAITAMSPYRYRKRISSGKPNKITIS